MTQCYQKEQSYIFPNFDSDRTWLWQPKLQNADMAMAALNLLESEIDKRYQAFYNHSESTTEKRIRAIAVIFDNLPHIVEETTLKNQVLSRCNQILRMGKAVGIHLVLNS